MNQETLKSVMQYTNKLANGAKAIHVDTFDKLHLDCKHCKQAGNAYFCLRPQNYGSFCYMKNCPYLRG